MTDVDSVQGVAPSAAAGARLRAVSDRQLVNAALRQDLVAFIFRVFQTLNPGTEYRHSWHIDAIAHQLTRCAGGEDRRLLITQPPRSLKSICVSVAYVAWMLGHDPSRKFICVSYSTELAADLARLFRAVVEADWYRQVFPRMRAAKDTGLEFVTAEGGGRYATSVSGTLTGRGADTIIIDDPMKAEEAMSKVVRDRVLGWYRSTLVSRLNDKTMGGLIVVMQRLHEEDLAGYLLAQGGWRHLDLPAIAIEAAEIPIGPNRVHRRAPGDVLHPEHEPQAVLDQIKAEIGSFNFSAQYQQRPVPAEGNLIKWKWFRPYEHPPAHNSDGWIAQSWDTASKAGDHNDYSVCTTWLIKGLDFYLLDVVRERLEYPALKRRVLELRRRWAPRAILVEDKGSGTSLIQDMRDAPGGVRPIGIEPEADKITRMATQAAHIEDGHVHVPMQAPWLDDFKAEILAFPHGKHDDQIDSLSQMLKWRRDRYRNRIRCGTVVGLLSW